MYLILIPYIIIVKITCRDSSPEPTLNSTGNVDISISLSFPQDIRSVSQKHGNSHRIAEVLGPKQWGIFYHCSELKKCPF